jgi:hypothetical protein
MEHELESIEIFVKFKKGTEFEEIENTFKDLDPFDIDFDGAEDGLETYRVVFSCVDEKLIEYLKQYKVFTPQS